MLQISCVQNKQSLKKLLYQEKLLDVKQISEDLSSQLQATIQQFLWYSLPLDKTTNVKDTMQSLVFNFN